MDNASIQQIIDWFVDSQAPLFKGPDWPKFLEILKEKPQLIELNIKIKFDFIMSLAVVKLKCCVYINNIDSFCEDVVKALQERFLQKEENIVKV